MKSTDADLYLMQDGTYAAPGDCSIGKDGVWRHKNGVGVALGADGEPMTMGDVTEINKDVALPASEKMAKDEFPVEDAKASSDEAVLVDGKLVPKSAVAAKPAVPAAKAAEPPAKPAKF